MTARTAHRFLVAATLIGGAFELTSIPFVEQPLASLTTGLLFLVVCAWLARGHDVVAPALLGLLFAVELSGEPFYSRHTVADWALQGALGILSLIGLAAAIVVVMARRRLTRRA